jgi:dipeptide/tripeptide permease
MENKADTGTSWKFPREFWTANLIELFERAAFYGMFIYITHYLTKEVGFSDVEAGSITGAFGFLLYFLPTFQGILADRIGFKSALGLAFCLLTAGYALLGAVPQKWAASAALLLIVLGGAIVKPVISGTAAKCSTDANRSRAMALFYMAVNIGSFYGKWAVEHVRTGFDRTADAAGAAVGATEAVAEPEAWYACFGNAMISITRSCREWLDGIGIEISDLQAVNVYAAVMAVIALFLAIFVYRNVDRSGVGKSMDEVLSGFARVLCNFRFLSLIMIVGGFWAIQGQLYATMPKYLLRMTDEFAKPGWIANVNPLVVVLCVVPITWLVRKIRPITSIGIGLLIIPLSPLPVALAPLLGSSEITLPMIGIGVTPLVLMLIVGIVFQGLAECFLSPRFLEYASKQAPPGEVGLYMGYSHLTSAFSWLFAFVMSGFLLERYCPSPDKVAEMPAELAAHAYDHAHYIWFFWFGIGILAFVALLVFKRITDRIDAQKEKEAG